VKWLKEGKEIVMGLRTHKTAWMTEGGPQMMMAVRAGVSGVEVLNRVAVTSC
jgi:hypothetical protein